MTFADLDYLFLFLPLVVGAYYIFRRHRFANLVILGASYYFYGSSGLWLLVPLLATSLLDFGVGIALSQVTNASWRKALLALSLIANLGLLGFFKYSSWISAQIGQGLAAIGMPIALPALSVMLPPGISFYTFQTMSYTIEVYRGEMRASRRLIDYLAFVTFWPHLVAGPIMRARTLLPQLSSVRPIIDAETARWSILLIAWGLLKKLVLADNFGHIVDMIENDIGKGLSWPGQGILFAYAFAGQIYCDFSAYTDIARGSAKLVGVDLVRNFHTPYFAASPTEFWHRWHISLSTWLRDYLYIPLGGNRRGRWIEYRNLLVTMVLGGLWHGAGFLFLAWGAWHGLALLLYRVLPIDKILTERLGRLGRLVAIALTFHIVCFGWLLFRAQPQTLGTLLATVGELFSPVSLGMARELLHAAASHAIAGSGLLQIAQHAAAACWGITVLGAVVLLTDYLGYRRGVEFTDLLRSLRGPGWGVAMVVCYFGIVLLARRTVSQFIYFQF